MKGEQEVYEELSKKAKDIHLNIATPMYGGLCTTGYTKSFALLLNHLSALGVRVSFNFLDKESLITRARNDLVYLFLNSDATHLIFIDADITFNPLDVMRMLLEDKDILCGVYPKKEIDWDRVKQGVKNNWHLPTIASEYAFNSIDEEPILLNFNSDKVVEVKEAATGFMLIKREVFDKLKSKVNTYISNYSYNKGNIIYEYFYTCIDKQLGILLSEDYAFCSLWRDNGGEIYVAPWVRLQHTGTHTYG